MQSGVSPGPLNESSYKDTKRRLNILAVCAREMFPHSESEPLLLSRVSLLSSPLRATRVSVCVGQRGLCPRSQRETGHLEQHQEEAKDLRGLGFPKARLARLLVSGQGPGPTAKPVCRAPSARCRSGLDTLQSRSANWHGGSISFLVALHMINWTIGQLGLGEAQVLGMGPQGTSKDKGASARLDADLSLESLSPVSFCSFNFLLTLSGTEKKTPFEHLFSSLRQLDAVASFSVSHFAKAYGCMCKNSSDA